MNENTGELQQKGIKEKIVWEIEQNLIYERLKGAIIFKEAFKSRSNKIKM